MYGMHFYRRAITLLRRMAAWPVDYLICKLREDYDSYYAYLFVVVDLGERLRNRYAIFITSTITIFIIIAIIVAFIFTVGDNRSHHRLLGTPLRFP